MIRKLATACAALFALAGAGAADAQRAPPVAIVGAKVIDGTGRPAIDNATVVVADGKITAVGPRAAVRVPPGAEVVDGAGKALMPGLIDLHCHINQPADVMRRLLPVALNWGVTTIRMTGNDKPEIMNVYTEARAGRFPSPRVFTAGQGFNPTGGPYPGAPTLNPKTPEEAREGVRRHKALGAQLLKIWMADPGFPPDVLAAIVDEAKKQGLTVTVHIASVAQIKKVADLGVTDIMHEARDGMTPEFVAYAKAHHLTFVPTLGQGQSRWYYYEHPEFVNVPAKYDGFYARGRAMLADEARKQSIIGAPDFQAQKQAFRERMYPFIKYMWDAGVPVAVGTDCGAEASQTTPIGHTTHQEIAMYVEAGLTPVQAIQAATLNGARIVEHTQDPAYGSVQVGKIADLLLVNGDPTRDITATAKIARVMQGGRWVP